MQGNSMNAMTDFRGRIGNVLGTQTLVDRFPGFAAIIRPKRARRGNCDEHSVLIFWVNKNRVQTHSARARLPLWAAVVFAEPRQLLPSCAPIFGFKKGRVFYAGVNVIGILECRLQVPDALKFPGMLCAVVPLMRTWRSRGRGSGPTCGGESHTRPHSRRCRLTARLSVSALAAIRQAR